MIIFSQWPSLVLLLGLWCAATALPLTTRGAPPKITSVTPSFGSVEGGTVITLSGANFLQAGLFTTRFVHVGGEKCEEIPYYTSDTSLRCVVPACRLPACLSSATWAGSAAASVRVYVQTVEGVLSDADAFSFTYSGTWTPSVVKMSKHVRANALFHVEGAMRTPSVGDLEVKIGPNRASVGDPGELNADPLSVWSNTARVNYVPPADLTAGYYNLSLSSQNDQSRGSVGTGSARMFPRQKARPTWRYPYVYNFDASMSGRVHSVVLQPAIRSVSPARGSVAGGTRVTITGSGFSSIPAQNRVFVAGRECAVQSSSHESIVCVTAAANTSQLLPFISPLKNASSFDASDVPFFLRPVTMRSPRSAGSPGWWVRLWKYSDYANNNLKASSVAHSFAFKSDMSFSLFYSASSSWPAMLQFADQRFAADFVTDVTIPITGAYRFLVSCDDTNYLYYTRKGESEKLLMTTYYDAVYEDIYTNKAAHESPALFFRRGERVRLRSRLLNTASGDLLKISLTISPNYTQTESSLSPSLVLWDVAQNDSQVRMSTVEGAFLPALDGLQDPVFLHHHSLKDVQIVSLSMRHQYEVQTVAITGIEGGSFMFIVQGLAVSDALTTFSTNADIANALSAASMSLSSSVRECSSYTVSKTLSPDGKYIYMRIQFNVDNSQPLSLLEVFTGDILGSNVSTWTRRDQLHTVIPSGSFDLSFDHETVHYKAAIPFNADEEVFRNALQAVNESLLNVDVRRSGSSLTGYSWVVVFTNPRGSLPLLALNTTGVIGQNVTGSVRKAQSGSEREFFFDTLPVWMTEVPLEISGSLPENTSNVEVYVNTSSSVTTSSASQSGGPASHEMLKAACDGANDRVISPGSDNAAWLSFLSGDETACVFAQASSATPLVSNYRLFDIDATRTGVEMVGNYLGENVLLTSVTIAGHVCEISSINGTHLVCVVSSVPWGEHVPQVSVADVGQALVLAPHGLRFKQSIYSLSPRTGSLAGGQLVRIEGRGFRGDAVEVRLGLGEEALPCEVVHASSTEVLCRAPRTRQFYAGQPSLRPTDSPTVAPSLHPTISPSLSPTLSPSLAPTHEPTEEPSLMPTEEPSSHFNILIDLDSNARRRLQSSSNQASLAYNATYATLLEKKNEYVLFIDGQASSPTAPLSYTYQYELTPVVQSVSPQFLSSAVSHNVTLTGFNLFHVNVSVEIGEEVCRHAHALDDFTVVCVLPRSASFGAARDVDVKLFVPERGYAAWGADLVSLPSVRRGFEIVRVLPSEGSVHGGNELTLLGFGFAEDVRVNQTIVLQQEDWSAYNDYDQMLMALGFPSKTVVPPQVFLDCLVKETSFHRVVCEIPHHFDNYSTASYNVSVVLNGVHSVCFSGENCTYSQLEEFTPRVYAHPVVLSETMEGALTVQVRGELFSEGEVSVSLSGYHCDVLNVTHNSVIFRTPPIPAGEHFVELTVAGLGFAQSEAYLLAHGGLRSVFFERTSGSLAGGPLVLIRGFGFSPECERNHVELLVQHNGNANGDRVIDGVPVSRWFYCTENEMLLELPSLLPLLTPEHVHTRDNYEAVVRGVNMVVDDVGANLPPLFTANFSLSGAEFAYSLSATPLAFVNATQGVAGDLLRVIVESPFAIDNSSLTVSLGDVPCAALHFLDVSRVDKIKRDKFYAAADCVVPQVSARNGSVDVLAWVHPYGYALLNTSSEVQLPRFKSLFRAHPLPTRAVTSSVQGQRNLTVSGKGFSNATRVTICGVPCDAVQPAKYDSLTVRVPARVTTQAVEHWRATDVDLETVVQLTLAVATYESSLTGSSAPATLQNAYDDDYWSYFSHNAQNCFVGVSLAAGMAARPYRMRFYPRLQYAPAIGNFVFEGKLVGASSFSPIATSSGAHEGWNVVDADAAAGLQWYTAFRYRALDSASKFSKCQLAEVDFWGSVAFLNGTCDVKVLSPETGAASVVGQVRYEERVATPVVRSVFPNNGTALGGTLVELSGENFLPSEGAADIDGVSVTLSGIPCAVRSATNHSIVCETGPRPPEAVQVSSVVVTVRGRGASVADKRAEFLYIDKWSALTSWRNQEPPVDGDIVWIPEGQVILLDEPTPVLTFLLVQGSLILDRTKDLSIDAHYVFVLGGYLEVGTHEEPFEKQAVITIHGDRYTSVELPFIGSKFLGVAEKGMPTKRMTHGEYVYSRAVGQLEVHGKKRLRTWTKVNATARAGENFLLTSEPVDFQPGERVILTGSERPLEESPEGFQFEELTVFSNIDGHNITFTTALRYTHRSEIVTVEGREIDLRCEIGLLSRNVIIQGDEEHSDGQIFGVHTIAMASGIYRMENAEIRRCGQAFNFGRYCTHSHMAKHMEGSYVKANSIHHSYQRACTTHTTDHWEVRDNVAFNVQGHAYFVEDGDEKLNSVTGNLGVYIRRSSALLKSDQKPAIFWTATPYNFWRDNVAAHSAMFGFWFELVAEKRGLCPIQMDLGEFRNNTLHGNGGAGIRIYPHWFPAQNPCVDDEPKPQYLYKMLSYRNAGNGLFSKKHGDIHHISPTFVENGGEDMSIMHYVHVNYTRDANIVDGLFIGNLNANVHKGVASLYLPQEEFFFVRNSTFVNYGSAGAITSCNGCYEDSEMNQGGSTYRFEALRFVNTPKRLRWTATKKDIYWDLDGSLGGVRDSMLTMNYAHLRWPECEELPESEYDTTIRCGGEGSSTRIRRLSLQQVTPSQLSYTDVMVRSQAGSARIFFLPVDSYGWVFPVVTGVNRSYSLDWEDAGISAYTLNYTLSREPYLLESMGLLNVTVNAKSNSNNNRYDESVLMRYQPHLWDYDPYSYTVKYAGKTYWAPRNNTEPLTQAKMAQSQFANRTIDVMVTTRGANVTVPWDKFSVSLTGMLCPPKGCPVPPPPSLSTPMLWSKPASWANNRVPRAGEKVVIDSNRWIVLDINTPRLGCIVVYGKLSFLSNDTNPLTLTLTAQCIQVFGYMEILGSDNATYVGQANVVIYGTKSQTLPVTMAEGKYIGGKVVAVAGSLKAMGQRKVHSWVRLGATVAAGSTTVRLSRAVDWAIGDTIALSPTAYYTATGKEWSTGSAREGPADELRVIKNITHHVFAEGADNNSNDTYHTVLELASPVNHTHLCDNFHGERYCGAVGVITRNVRFVGLDADNVKSTSYGFGAHLQVIDIVTSNPANNRYGYVELDSVEFAGFGKMNSDHYAITMDYLNHDHAPSTITHCSFANGYNTAFRTTSAHNTTFTHNVVLGATGGGVYIDAKSAKFIVEDNLVMGVRQLPSVLKSTSPWTRPIAAFTVFSPSGVVRRNLAAGSQDQGFSLAVKLFHVPSSIASSVCRVTYSQDLAYNALGGFDSAKVRDNEAVGCRTGFAMVTMSTSESASSDCAVLKGVKAWRSAHSGILLIDGMLNVVVTEALLAENFIGVNLLFHTNAQTAMAAVVNSTIVASLGSTGTCADLSDSKYIRGQHCAAFTDLDPLGVQPTCGSVYSELYRRVGISIPQWTNKGRTCATANRFEVCDPPNTPDRLCLLPWEKRYALPVDMLYAETHVHDVAFVGFKSRSYDGSTPSFAGDCIPSATKDRSVAIAVNPSQTDYQPVTVFSGLSFAETDLPARIGFDLGSFTKDCTFKPCSGQNQVIFNDLDGSFSGENVPAQLMYKDPNYIAPAPNCYEHSDMTFNLYICPQNNAQRLTQYSAIWRDDGPQIIQPLVTTRRLQGTNNRTFASYGPLDDMCAKRFYFSRFNTPLATGVNQRLMTTGTIPDTFMLRWDAPRETDVAVIEFFVHHGLNINVYVSDNAWSGFELIPKIDRYPNTTDVAGTNLRDPQNRFLAVTLRGGAKRYYKFVKVPVVPVTIRMDMTMSEFFGDTFIANIAMLLKIPASRIKITQVRSGSVIADFEIAPSVQEANSSTAVVAQIAELQSITSNITQAIVSGEITTALNVTVLEVYAEPPVVPVVLDPVADFMDNDSFNATAYRETLIVAAMAEVQTLFTYPTSMPTGQPSGHPSSQPSTQPTSSPTAQPSTQPTGQPSVQPTRQPTGQPTRQPTGQPTGQPSTQPTAQPTSPTSQPTSQPTRQPVAHPTGQPTRQPTSQPSTQPTRQPTGQPTGQPSSQPSSQPSTQPSASPTGVPTVAPTPVPTPLPSHAPTVTPTQRPTVVPTVSPTAAPTVTPSLAPSASPTVSPTESPTASPTLTMRPSHAPTVSPTAIPTITMSPSASPTIAPSESPTAVPTTAAPSYAPSVEPTEAPTVAPTHSPTHAPTHSPTQSPTVAPTHSPTVVPTQIPTQIPTDSPSAGPTLTFSPTHIPTHAPTEIPTQTPTEAPTHTPTQTPTEAPSHAPTEAPTHSPTQAPTQAPSAIPTVSPTNVPTVTPTAVPSQIPSPMPTPLSATPSQSPSIAPTAEPTMETTGAPSLTPTHTPTETPSLTPTLTPTVASTVVPTHSPTLAPTQSPTVTPTQVPTLTPTVTPTLTPTHTPTVTPTRVPTASPTSAFITLVSMNVSQTFSGVFVADLNNATARAALVTVIASTARTAEAGTPNVTITAITETVTSARRRASVSLSRRVSVDAQSTTSVTVSYTITYAFDASLSSQVNASSLRSAFVAQLTDSIGSGAFVLSLRTLDDAAFSSASTSSASLSVSPATTVTVSRPNTAPTTAPSAAPKKKDEDQTGMVAGIIVGAIVAVVLVGLCVNYLVHRPSPKQGIKVHALNGAYGDGGHAIVAVEREQQREILL